MPSDPSTWATLVAALLLWLSEDDGSAQLREFIALGERHLNRAVFTPDREAALSIAAEARSEALPADFWGFKTGPWVDGARQAPLEKVTPGRLRDLHPTAATGVPRHYAIEGETILFGPTPAGAAIKGLYYAVIPALGDETPSNWLLADHPDAYLAAALAVGFKFHFDEARAAYWEGQRDRLVAEINEAGRRRTNSGRLAASACVAQVRNIAS
jgi:hypothetical protein